MTPTSHERPTTRSSDQKMLLQIYLNDHRAGATAGIALVERMVSSNRGSALGDTLEALLPEIRHDAETLDRVAEQLDVRANPLKQVVAKVGERFGRLKPNGRLRGYSPLSRVLEIEAVIAAITMKRGLWESLRSISADDHIGDVDLSRVVARADAQRDRLMPHHEEAAWEAFGG